MHPALSVIFFTTTSGAGYGTLILLAFISLLDPASFIDDRINYIFVVSALIALVLVILGLLSSSLHLANKKNAWRAFFRFRSSWLSKEAVFAVLSFPIVFAFIIAFYFLEIIILMQIFAVLSILISTITIYSTGMIYACLKTIRAWNTPLVPFNYIILGLLTGSLVLLTIFNYYAIVSSFLEQALMLLLIIGFIAKLIYYKYLGEPASWSVKTATNLPGHTVRLLDTGESATGSNFLTKEFGFVIGPKTIMILRILSVFLTFIVPSIIFFSLNIGFMLLTLLLVSNYIGIMIGRWLFFAEAKHVVNLFYGRKL